MKTLSERILEILDELVDKDFRRFQWHLREPSNLEGLGEIPLSRLDGADRPKTTDLITGAYGDEDDDDKTLIIIIENILGQMNKLHLLKKFPLKGR